MGRVKSKEASARWTRSEKGKAAFARYARSAKGKATRRRYLESPKGRKTTRAQCKRWNATEKGKATRRRYHATPEAKAAAYRRRMERRGPLPPKDTRPRTNVTVRMLVEERDLIENAAWLAGMPISTWMRALALEKAEEI